jgi:hypothetical protein
MFEHPLYSPKSAFKRCKNLPVNLIERYDMGWIVWEKLEDLPTLWVFYQKDKLLTIKTQSVAQTLSWNYLKESRLLLLYKNKNSEPEAYEIYETKDGQYLKLKNVANEQVFYAVLETMIDADMREYLLTFSIDVLLGKDYSNYPTHILTEAKIAKKTMALGCLVHAIILVASAFTVESLVTLVCLVSPFTYLFGIPAYTSKRIKELRAKQNFSSFGLKKIQENYSGFTYLVLRFAIGFVGFFAYGYLFYNQR